MRPRELLDVKSNNHDCDCLLDETCSLRSSQGFASRSSGQVIGSHIIQIMLGKIEVASNAKQRVTMSEKQSRAQL